MRLTTYLYGPQTSGKTTRLLRIIQHDHGNDLAFSGEDQTLDNGKFMTNVTAQLPRGETASESTRFIQQVRLKLRKIPVVKHILIDGAQFLSMDEIKIIYRILRKMLPRIPIVFSGCLYYLQPLPHRDIIPTSRFLLHNCWRVVPVIRHCDFCKRNASRFWARKIQVRGRHTILAKDPHLVCQFHYQKLRSV